MEIDFGSEVSEMEEKLTPETDFVVIDEFQDCDYLLRITVEELMASPLRVNELPLEEQRQLLLQLPALVIALAATSALVPMETAKPAKQEPDTLLTAEEAAVILNVAPSWLYSHAKRLPFANKLSHKRLRFSRLGIEKWLAAKR